VQGGFGVATVPRCEFEHLTVVFAAADVTAAVRLGHADDGRLESLDIPGSYNQRSRSCMPLRRVLFAKITLNAQKARETRVGML
jgi:hypothetical protein